MNYSSTIDTFESLFMTGLFPARTQPISCRAAISIGKLNGVIMATGPYGNL